MLLEHLCTTFCVDTSFHFGHIRVEFRCHMVTRFNFLRKLQKVHRSCTILHSHQHCIRVPISLHSCQRLSFFVFFIIAKLVKEYCLVGLFCISLMADSVEETFMCLLTNYVSSLENYLFKYFTHVLIELFAFLLNSKSSLYILVRGSLSDIQFINIFFHSMGCLFIFLVVFFDTERFLI